MMVFSLFEFILGIKRYSFLGFSYNHWYDKWIKSRSSRLSQNSFFFFFFFLTRWVGPCDIVARLAAAPPFLALEIPSLRFLPSPWKNGARHAGFFGDCSALSRTFEGSTWSRSIISQTLHWSYSGSGLHSRFLTAEESNFQTVLLLCFHKRERTFAISCSRWVDDWLKSAMLRKEGGPQQIKVLHP